VKTQKIKLSLVLFLTALLFNTVQAQTMMNKLNSLGGDKDLIRKARALDPDNKVRIVQNRTVSRTWRLELGINYGMVAGGDPYLITQNFGGNLDLHINPMWSVGARYYNHYNELSSEGQRVFNDRKNLANSGNAYDRLPAVDFPIHSELGVLSFYPIYGKLNLFDYAVAQFDVYVLGGYGQMKLKSGSSPTWTAGGGIGVWLSQHFASRLEVRYQNYQDQIYSGVRDENQIITNFTIGFLL
jgi:outer membrane beta-barrel protein